MRIELLGHYYQVDAGMDKVAKFKGGHKYYVDEIVVHSIKPELLDIDGKEFLHILYEFVPMEAYDKFYQAIEIEYQAEIDGMAQEREA